MITFRDQELHVEGRRVSISLWAAQDANRAVVISPAMGVSRSFYRYLGEYLANNGFHVISYDYDGMYPGATLPPSVSISEWPRIELFTAIEEAKKLGDKVYLIGHSIGGQILPLAPNANDLSAAFMVAVQNVSATRWSGKERILIELFWRAVIPFNLFMFNRLLAISYGGKRALHPKIASEWFKMGVSPNGLVDAFPEARQAYQMLNIPVKFNSLYDDKLFAPKESVASLVSMYGQGEVIHDHLTKADCEGQAVGHFNFFRPEASFLWPRILDWFSKH